MTDLINFFLTKHSELFLLLKAIQKVELIKQHFLLKGHFKKVASNFLGDTFGF